MKELFRALPAVDVCLRLLEEATSPDAAPRPLVREAVNAFLDRCRSDIREGRVTSAEQVGMSVLAPRLAAFVRERTAPHFRRVLNATGVVLHTNMGRSVLAESAVRAVTEACRGYSNLELDLSTGERGSRYSHVEDLLCSLTGAEAALVVNNNAAAVFLVLDALCRGREVVVARGQLVEIGGSFRIPDVMARSGAVLREVGCTNRVHPADYERAITPETAALLRVHTSNYRVVGFHTDVPAADMARLAHERDLLFIEDLGSGSFLDFSSCGLPGEPTVRSVVEAGADVVTFSGDKVLGGPQAGIIVGRREAVARIKRSPLNRALRIDKMTLAALEATLRLYLDEDRAGSEIPTLRMICVAPEVLRARAGRLAGRLRRKLGSAASVTLRSGASRVGGGAFPEHDLPTTLIAVHPAGCGADDVRRRLLRTDPPLLGRVEDDAFCLDVRTLDDADAAAVAHVLADALDVADGLSGPAAPSRNEFSPGAQTPGAESNL